MLFRSPEPARFGPVRGEVWVHRGPVSEKAKPDGALLPGDRLVAGGSGRTVLHLGPAAWLQIDGHADFRILRIEAASRELQLEGGAVTCHFRDASAGEIRIATPNVAVRVFQEGVYRISISKTGDTEALSLEGEAEVLAPGGSQLVAAGRKLIARGPASGPEFRIVNGVGFWRRVVTALSEHGHGGGGFSTPDDAPAPAAAAEEKPKQETPIAREAESISRQSSGSGARR